ncbi:glycosyltransferase [Patescibacteria group bacterium]|nr:glycosyltransferase [Patescibacteria group bacterium]
MRIALVHDYFIQDGGAERVFVALHKLFPEAPVYTLIADPNTFPPGFAPKTLITSALQHLLPNKQWYPIATPLMPMATEGFDFSGFDRVIISSSGFMKGIIAPPEAKTLCYLHTPTRFLWEGRHSYAKGRGWPWIARLPLHYAFHRLRNWDHHAAQRPETLLTNSATSQARIQRYYQRAADVVHPPIDLREISCTRTDAGKFWLTGGRLVSYKRFDLCIEAANVLGAPLKVFGVGPQLSYLKKIAGPTVEFLGTVSDATKYELYRDAYAFLHAGVEDFGVTMIEAQASGTPVIAYAGGGALEIIPSVDTGALVNEQTPAAFAEAMRSFDPNIFDPAKIRLASQRFDINRFNEAILRYANVH